MKRLLALLILSVLFLSACECVSGFGRDVQKAGKWMETQSEHAKKK